MLFFHDEKIQIIKTREIIWFKTTSWLLEEVSLDELQYNKQRIYLTPQMC